MIILTTIMHQKLIMYNYAHQCLMYYTVGSADSHEQVVN